MALINFASSSLKGRQLSTVLSDGIDSWIQIESG